MSSDRGGLRDDIRAASEIVGYALLVGIVFLSALLIVVYGSSLITDAQSSVNEESSELVLQELDSKFGTVTSLSDVQRVRFDLGDTAPKDLRVVQEGFINVTIDERPATCQARLDLSSIRYRTEDDRIIGYEAGGVWRGEPDGGTVMLTSPDVTFQNGTVTAAVTNVTGQITESTNEAVLNDSFSETLTARKTDRLRTGDCVRPDNVTVKVNGSTFYRAWGNYFRNEFGHARTFENNRTVLTRLEQSELREVANDELNNVVNLSQSSPPDYMGPSGATIVDNPGDPVSDGKPDRIAIDKSAGNTYTVQYQPLANATSFPVSNRETIVRSVAQEGVGTDAVFVIDDSGSMECDIDQPGCDNPGNSDDFDVNDRLPAAKTAASRSLVVLNDADRVGLVGYQENATVKTVDGELLTTNAGSRYFDDYDAFQASSSGYKVTSSGIENPSADGFNGTLQTLEAGGGTCIYCGLDNALQTLGVASNQSRNQTIILLTDGNNNVQSDSAVLDLAEYASARNITINTVRIGGTSGSSTDPDCSTSLLECIAEETGGEYLDTTDQDELREFFKESLRTTETTDVVRRTALTTNATASGRQIYDPYVAGDTDNMVQTQNGFLNVNDPLAPSTFRHSFAVTDDDAVYFNASWYGCTDRDFDDGPGEPEQNWSATPVVRGGDTVYRCNDPNSDDEHNISNENVTIYTDGHVVGVDETDANPGGDPDEWSTYVSGSPSLGSAAPLLNNSTRAWQQNMTEQLAGYLETSAADYDGDGTDETVWELNLSSNEAIVVYNYSVAGERYDDANRLAMIYRIGLSESAARPESLVNVRASKLELGEG